MAYEVIYTGANRGCGVSGCLDDTSHTGYSAGQAGSFELLFFAFEDTEIVSVSGGGWNFFWEDVSANGIRLALLVRSAFTAGEVSTPPVIVTSTSVHSVWMWLRAQTTQLEWPLQIAVGSVSSDNSANPDAPDTSAVWPKNDSPTHAITVAFWLTNAIPTNLPEFFDNTALWPSDSVGSSAVSGARAGGMFSFGGFPPSEATSIDADEWIISVGSEWAAYTVLIKQHDYAVGAIHAGAAWTAVGQGPILISAGATWTALASDPGGKIIAGGRLTASTLRNLANLVFVGPFTLDNGDVIGRIVPLSATSIRHHFAQPQTGGGIGPPRPTVGQVYPRGMGS